jgi:hypothetical protein
MTPALLLASWVAGSVPACFKADPWAKTQGFQSSAGQGEGPSGNFPPPALESTASVAGLACLFRKSMESNS